jgi:hypothetical protein
LLFPDLKKENHIIYLFTANHFQQKSPANFAELKKRIAK